MWGRTPNGIEAMSRHEDISGQGWRGGGRDYAGATPRLGILTSCSCDDEADDSFGARTWPLPTKYRSRWHARRKSRLMPAIRPEPSNVSFRALHSGRRRRPLLLTLKVAGVVAIARAAHPYEQNTGAVGQRPTARVPDSHFRGKETLS